MKCTLGNTTRYSRHSRPAMGGWPVVVQLLTLVPALAVVIGAIAADSFGRAQVGANPLVKVGECAPDFELPRLTITTDPNGEPVGVISELDQIRLSSFRGKKPVCLIMSSYT